MSPALARSGLVAISASALFLASPLVAKFEGLRNDPYWDVGNVRTVCYGETHGIEERRYSTTECRAMLSRGLASHGNEIAKCLPFQTPISVQAAFASVGYNIGSTAFCKSSMSRKAMAGDMRGACAAISLYVYVAGKDCRLKASRCPGIVARRAQERSLCELDLAPTAKS